MDLENRIDELFVVVFFDPAVDMIVGACSRISTESANRQCAVLCEAWSWYGIEKQFALCCCTRSLQGYMATAWHFTRKSLMKTEHISDNLDFMRRRCPNCRYHVCKKECLCKFRKQNKFHFIATAGGPAAAVSMSPNPLSQVASGPCATSGLRTHPLFAVAVK